MRDIKYDHYCTIEVTITSDFIYAGAIVHMYEVVRCTCLKMFEAIPA
ncbi:MAG: hypothetical protein IJ733_01755 [Lachnospiraceae bacterium]|nr:hypothetical protein [Lachnospiraceae bacterium]